MDVIRCTGDSVVQLNSVHRSILRYELRLYVIYYVPEKIASMVEWNISPLGAESVCKIISSEILMKKLRSLPRQTECYHNTKSKCS